MSIETDADAIAREFDADRHERDPARHPLCCRCGDYHPRWEYAERREGGAVRRTCPTCGRDARRGDRFGVFEGLFVAIASNRRGVHADRMARTVLRYECGTRELVGLTADAERALYCNTEARRIVTAAFDKHGVYEAVESVAKTGDAGVWTETVGETLVWTHPRSRTGR